MSEHAPFPDPKSPILALIVKTALAARRSGEATERDAIVYAAVNGWMEGHIEGEDDCAGCHSRDLRVS